MTGVTATPHIKYGDAREIFASSLLFLTSWPFPLCHSGTISESKGLPMHSLRLRLVMSSFHGSLEAIYLPLSLAEATIT